MVRSFLALVSLLHSCLQVHDHQHHISLTQEILTITLNPAFLNKILTKIFLIGRIVFYHIVWSLLALVGLLYSYFQVCDHQHYIPLTQKFRLLLLMSYLLHFSIKFQQKIVLISEIVSHHMVWSFLTLVGLLHLCLQVCDHQYYIPLI